MARESAQPEEGGQKIEKLRYMVQLTRAPLW